MDRWLIVLGAGYGSLVVEGTEESAEYVRCRKSKEEMRVARKWRIPDLDDFERQGLHCVNGEAGFLDSTLMSRLVELGVCEWRERKITASPLGKWILEQEKQVS